MDNTNVMPEENVAAVEEEEMFDMSAAGEEEEMFDMSAAANNAADEMMQKAKEEEMKQFKELEGFASIFPEKWAIEPPKVDGSFFRNYIAKKNAEIAKK